MALKKKPVNTTEEEIAATTETETPAPTEATTTAVAPVAKTPTPPPAKKAEMTGLLFANKQDLHHAPFGTLPRLKASNGNITDSDGKILGSFVDVQIMSWNNIWVISPNDKAAPKELVRYSYDNKTFEEDPSVDVVEYLQDMKHAWPNAASKQYAEVICVLHNSEKSSELKGKMVQLNLAPTSQKAFEGFFLTGAFEISSGAASPEQAELIRFTATIARSNGNEWTKLVPSFAPIA